MKRCLFALLVLPWASACNTTTTATPPVEVDSVETIDEHPVDLMEGTEEVAIDTFLLDTSQHIAISTTLQQLQSGWGQNTDCQVKDLGFRQWFYQLLNREMATTVFSDVVVAYVTTVKATACITIEEWGFASDDKAAAAFEVMEQIKERNIAYKPPMNWLWHHRNNKVFFIHSETLLTTDSTMQAMLKHVQSME